MRLRMEIKSSMRIYNIFFLSCVTLPIFGCFLATYPSTYDASAFEDFQFRQEVEPPCLESSSISEEDPSYSYGPVCEATITREASGQYIVLLGVRTDFQSGSPYLPPRALTESEINRMLTLFAELRTNMHPRPFCNLPLAGDILGEIFVRWDDFELVTNDCDRARLDFRQVFSIGLFLDSLVAGYSAEQQCKSVNSVSTFPTNHRSANAKSTKGPLEDAHGVLTKTPDLFAPSARPGMAGVVRSAVVIRPALGRAIREGVLEPYATNGAVIYFPDIYA